MKKLLIVLLSAAIMSVPGCKKDGDLKNDLKRLRLTGKIKSIRSIEYAAGDESGKIVRKERSSTGYSDSYTVFNSKGDITELVYFDSNEIMSQRRLMKFNEKGKIIEETWYKSEAAPENRFIYKYDKKGNMIEVTGFIKGKDQCNHRTLYRYDEKGNQIERDDYYPCDALSSKIVWKYDDRGNMLEEVFSGVDGKYGLITVNTYDAADKLIESSEGGDSESVILKKTFKYDDKGNCTERVTSRTDGNYHLREVFRYEYDIKGNWIKRVQFTDSGSGTIPDGIVEREIRYFD